MKWTDYYATHAVPCTPTVCKHRNNAHLMQHNTLRIERINAIIAKAARYNNRKFCEFAAMYKLNRRNELRYTINFTK